MELEVALLSWSKSEGVRCLGRARDPELVELVRSHLISNLSADGVAEFDLHLVGPLPENGGSDDDV